MIWSNLARVFQKWHLLFGFSITFNVSNNRFVRRKWPKWFTPNCISMPSFVNAYGHLITPALLIKMSNWFSFSWYLENISINCIYCLNEMLNSFDVVTHTLQQISVSIPLSSGHIAYNKHVCSSIPTWIVRSVFHIFSYPGTPYRREHHVLLVLELLPSLHR